MTASADAFPGPTEVDGNTVREPVTVQPPCACGDQEIVNVAQIIANGKVHNDNAQTGFDPNSLSLGFNAVESVELPAHAFVTSVSVGGQLTLVVNQKTSLFVEGDVAIVMNGSLSLEIASHGELDLYIGGNLTLVGRAVFGDPNRPSKLRVYVVGDQKITLAGTTSFAGNLYAPRATVMMGGGQTFYGSVFAGNVESSVQTAIHYDSAVIREGRDCNPANRCDACTDCEATSGCVDGHCGPCHASTDCCEPLVCVGGQCSVRFVRDGGK
jgi:hypothetical protein